MSQTSTQAQMFLNRVAKNYKHLKRRARREGIECFRVYDRDIPELSFALDVYGQRAHLQEYSAPVTEVRAQREWRSAMHAATAQALDIPLRQVVLKQRHGQRPDVQYRKLGPRGEDFIVGEGGHRFIVNLTDYLDTGLFLDHRQTRALVQSLARAGAFSICSAIRKFFGLCSGGRRENQHQRRLVEHLSGLGRRNFELNGMDAGRHRLDQADARRFVRDEAVAGQRYDLIVLDPPSFSNSKRMQGVLDVQRDHVALIRGCVEFWASAGDICYPSTRGFEAMPRSSS